MAGTRNTFQVKNPFLHTGYVETLYQITDAFNAASLGSIRLLNADRIGDFYAETFYPDTPGTIARRDTAVVTPVADIPVSQDENVSVKLNRRIGPVSQTRDSFKKVGRTPALEEISMVVGQQSARATQKEMLDSAVLAARAALITTNGGALLHSTTDPITTKDLVSGLQKFGDNSSSIVAWVKIGRAHV